MKGTATTKTNQAKKPALDCCHRCGGLMVSELSTDTGTAEWHCVTCGDRVDQVILARRQHREVQQEAEQVFAGSSHSRLN
jgi:tRNA(Ile2) C34 agmatinyltransferase TiaS